MRKHSGSVLVAALITALLVILAPINLKWTKAMNDKTNHQNRLADEKSPYLLQHADNPVDWYPWGEEAFEKARSENKPIFLSIGYSTCHWCHVMEHESFEDEDVAALMNDVFVSIKVDREERPDLDNIYMTAARLLNNRGGWPLTIIMTPDKKPFFAATYIPKESRYGRVGMLELIPRLKEVWNSKRDELDRTGNEVVAALNKPANGSGTDLGESILSTAYNQFKRNFDSENGGFGNEPKFPTPHNLMFLLRHWKRTGNDEALRMVERTLQEMRQGGIYDHVGYGFHRYSTDAQWLLPHFEKMLYDQALLAMAYTETYLATGKKEYEDTAREIFEYVLRDMTDPGGGFYSAEDADSEGEEGKFYVWSEKEIKEILDEEKAKLIIDIYNIVPGGNFTEQGTGRTTGDNIPHLKDSWKNLSKRFDIPEKDLRQKANEALEKLFKIREKRVHPYKDDKILTDWNGLMIAALASAGRAFDAPEYIDAAKRSVDFVLGKMKTSEGRLLHRYRDGHTGIAGNIDDYAFVVFGLLELYQTTFEIEYLEQALEINNTQIRYFRDDQAGAFYFTPDDGEELIVRQKEIYDGAVPSGNSVAAYNLLRLARITGNSEFEEMSSRIVRLFSAEIGRAPTAYTFLLLTIDFAVGPSGEIVIVGDKDSRDTNKMIKAINREFIPNKIVVFKANDGDSKKIDEIVSYISGFEGNTDMPTIYFCRDFVCDLPVNSVDQMMAKLETWTNSTRSSKR
ncbi:MAG: thioredoxin domain-containing protein [candidate division Zixibacteria bacterium]